MNENRHINLPSDFDNKKLYEAIENGLKRCLWRQAGWSFVLLSCAIGAVLVSNHPEWLWIFGGILAAERLISVDIEIAIRWWTKMLLQLNEEKNPASALRSNCDYLSER